MFPKPRRSWNPAPASEHLAFSVLVLSNHLPGSFMADEVHTGTQGRTGKEGEWIAGGEGTSRISNMLV